MDTQDIAKMIGQGFYNKYQLEHYGKLTPDFEVIRIIKEGILDVMLSTIYEPSGKRFYLDLEFDRNQTPYKNDETANEGFCVGICKLRNHYQERIRKLPYTKEGQERAKKLAYSFVKKTQIFMKKFAKNPKRIATIHIS